MRHAAVVGISVHRWAAAVVLAAVVGAAAFRLAAPPAVEAPLAVAALAVPGFVLQGDDVGVFGAADLPAGFEGARHLVVCGADGRCAPGTPGRLAGSGPWQGPAGTLPSDAVGPLEVAWALGIDVGLDGPRTVALARGASVVGADPEVGDAAP